jgi:predicted secreted protein
VGWVSGFVVYVILWWLVFFLTLPWGVRVPDEPEPGHASSAPANPRLGLKAGVTTVLAGVLWGVAYWIVEADLISFRKS